MDSFIILIILTIIDKYTLELIGAKLSKKFLKKSKNNNCECLFK